jgi:4-diphosphocytidyl-2-C-methyl-D-erythritol kinase
VTTLSIAAPGKLNLCLYLGPTRDDGLHEIASLFESVSLHDTLTVRELEDGEDRVICERIPGENLAGRALSACRETGLLSGPPLELTIEKRIPVAAGMGGGSADAAAALRLVGELEGHPVAAFTEVAFSLGADVPSQLTPGASLVHGAGERVVQIDPRCFEEADRTYVIVAQSIGLSTADVFAQADRIELADDDIVDRENTLLEAISGGVDFTTLCDLVENALEPAIVALRPELAGIPGTLRSAGARCAAFTGSGPTCFGIFETRASAEIATAKLNADGFIAHLATPVGADFADPRREGATV